MRNIVILLALVCLIACQKEFKENPASVNAEMQSSDATTTSYNIIWNQKLGINGYYPWQSDTIYAARTPGISVLMYGNSLIENWRYVSWESTWRGIPVINRGVGGKTLKETLPHIQYSVFDYQPKVVVMYGEENVFLRATDQLVALNEAVMYFDSTYNVIRRQYPYVRFIVHSMMTCPKLYNKGFHPAITAYNDYMKQKVMSDSGGYRINKWVDMRPDISYSNVSLYKADSIHLAPATYAVWTSRLKPLVTEVLGTEPPKAVADNGGDNITVAVSDTVTVPKSWNYNPTLWGTKSKSNAGGITSMLWKFVSGPTECTIVSPTANRTKISNFDVGTYVFTLTISNNKGYVSAPDSVTLVVTR